MLFTMQGPMAPMGPQNLEYTQYMQGSLHSRDFGQHLGAGRIGTKLTEVSVAMDEPSAARALYTGKLGFKADQADKNSMELPGAASERVDIVAEKPLGHKARIGLDADLPQAAAMLQARGLAFTQSGDGAPLTLSDPDGNEQVLRSSAMVADIR